MKTLVVLCLFLVSISLSGQNGENLVPNGNFHGKSECPFSPNFTVNNWYQTPSNSSADYYNLCAFPTYTIPNNAYGFQESITGEAYVGLITRNVLGGEFREYIEVTLSQSLIFAGCYELYMSYNKSNASGYTNNLGLLISDGSVSNFNAENPQIEITNIITDTVNWIEASVQYIATGNESHVTIGNFKNNANTIFDPGMNGDAYYLIDSVSVTYIGVHSTDVDIELGDDIYVCSEQLPVMISSNNPNAVNVWDNGTIGPAMFAFEAGIYYLTIYDGCEFGRDSIEVFVFEEPEFELDDDLSLCEGEVFTFDLDPSLGTYEWNDGSSNINYSISESGTYTVSLIHDCGIIEEEIEVEVGLSIDLPEIEDFYMCTEDLPLLVPLNTLMDGVNEFDWSTGSDESVVFLWEGGDFSVTVFNECFEEEREFQVFVSDELPEDIGFVDTLLCPGESTYINTGITDLDTELMWDDGSTDTSYLVTEPGIYILTASNYCEEKTYTFEINESFELEFDLGPDLSICPGDSALLISPIGEELLWNGTIVADEIWVNEEGVFYAEFIGVCNTATDSVEILLNGESPVIDLPDSLLLCAGDSILLSTGTGNVGVDFTWNTGNMTPEIYVSEAGVYDVVGLNSCGSDMDSVIVTLGESLPNVVLDNVYIICPGDTLDLIVEPGNADIAWSTGSMDSIVQITDVGPYTLTLQNICATEEIAFELQFEDTLNVFDLGEDISICQGETADLVGPIADGSYEWTTEEITSSIEVVTPGIYMLEIEGICNTVMDSLEVIDLGVEPTVDLGENVLFCEGDSITLTLAGTDINEILWNTGDTTEMVQVFNEGTYYVDVMNVCGMNSDSIVLTFNPDVPVVELGENMEICEGDSILLDVGGLGGTIIWNTGDSGQSIFASEEGWYEANLSSSCGESTDSVFISTLAGPPAFDLGADTTICIGTNIEIDLPNLGLFDIEWQDGSIFPTNTLNEAQIYWMNVSNECGDVRDSINIDFHPSIDPFSFDPVEDLCFGDTVILDGYQDNVITFTWQDNSDESSYVVTESGLYSLQVDGACESFDSEIEIDFIEQEVFGPNIDPSYIFCEGKVLSLDLESNGIDRILWFDGSEEFERIFEEAGSYVFQLFNFCQDSTYSFDLAYEDCISDLIYVPNIFTPNDDGNNDFFGMDLPIDWIDPSVEAAVYNRWGERMFYSEEADFSWDGQFKGKTLNPSVYVYIIKIEIEIKEELREFVLQGDITIVR